MSADIPDYVVNVSQMSGFRFTNADENLVYFDEAIKNNLKNVIVGLERNNLKNRVEINDRYSPEIDVFYTGHDTDVTSLVKEMCTDFRVKFLKSDKIFRNSDDVDDVNITELRRSVVSVKASSTEMNKSCLLYTSTIIFKIKWPDETGRILLVFLSVLVFAISFGSVIGIFIKNVTMSYTSYCVIVMIFSYLGGAITPVYVSYTHL